MKPFKNFATRPTEMKFFDTEGKEYYAEKASKYWDLFVKDAGSLVCLGSIQAGKPTPKKLHEYLA